MNTKIFFLLLVFFVLSCKDNSNAKKVKTSENLTVKTNSIKQSPKESLEVATKKDTLDPRIKPFIENGMEVLAIETGDLNLDGIEDKLLATQNIVLADSVQEPNFRKLAILIGQKNNTFKLVASNEKCLYTTDMSGMSMTDPFSGLAIKNGYFSIESEVAGGQHWSQIITFKYNKSKNNWFLYKVHFISYELDDNGELALQTDTTTTVKNFGEIAFKRYDLIQN